MDRVTVVGLILFSGLFSGVSLGSERRPCEISLDEAHLFTDPIVFLRALRNDPDLLVSRRSAVIEYIYREEWEGIGLRVKSATFGPGILPILLDYAEADLSARLRANAVRALQSTKALTLFDTEDDAEVLAVLERLVGDRSVMVRRELVRLLRNRLEIDFEMDWGEHMVQGPVFASRGPRHGIALTLELPPEVLSVKNRMVGLLYRLEEKDPNDSIQGEASSALESLRERARRPQVEAPRLDNQVRAQLASLLERE